MLLLNFGSSMCTCPCINPLLANVRYLSIGLHLCILAPIIISLSLALHPDCLNCSKLVSKIQSVKQFSLLPTCRTVVKELQGYQEPLQKLLVRLRVHAQAEPQYAVFVPYLGKSTKELDAYIEQSLANIWQLQALPLDKAI